jgi:hypothetical protein
LGFSEADRGGLEKSVGEVFRCLSDDLGTDHGLRQALESVENSPSVLVLLDALVEKDLLPMRCLRNLPALLSRSSQTRAQDVLYRILAQKDSRARDCAVVALVERHGREPERELKTPLIRVEIDKLVTASLKAQELMRFFEVLRRENPSQTAEKADSTFVRAQKDRIRENTKTLFQLLSLLSGVEDANSIFEALDHESGHLRANALELLDNIIKDQKLKDAIFHLMEEDLISDRASRDNATKRNENAFDKLFDIEDPWSVLSLACLAADFPRQAFLEKFRAHNSSEDNFMKEITKLVGH